MLAALNSLEPPNLELATAKILKGHKPWSTERLPLVVDRGSDRLIEARPGLKVVIRVFRSVYGS